MTATLIERNTDSLLSSGVPPFQNFPVLGGEKILYGTIVLVTPNGVAEGIASTGGLGAGIALATQDNLTGANGDKTVDVGFGVFYVYSGTGPDAITAADFGKMAYVIDNQTVGLTDGTGTRSKAGVIININPAGEVGIDFSVFTARLSA